MSKAICKNCIHCLNKKKQHDLEKPCCDIFPPTKEETHFDYVTGENFLNKEFNGNFSFAKKKFFGKYYLFKHCDLINKNGDCRKFKN